MRMSLVVLLLIAAGLLVYRLFVVAPSGPPAVDSDVANAEPAKDAHIPVVPEWEQEPPDGDVPSSAAEIEVRVEVRQQGPQSRLHFFLSEKHGWWVDQIYIAFWYQDVDPQTGEWHKYAERIEFIPKAIEFAKTAEHDFVIYQTDLPPGKPKGTAENWGVRVVKWGEDRVRSPREGS